MDDYVFKTQFTSELVLMLLEIPRIPLWKTRIKK